MAQLPNPGVTKSERSSIDDIIDLYKRDVDRTLLDECLRRTVEERIQALEEFDAFRDELQAGMKRRDAIR